MKPRLSVVTLLMAVAAVAVTQAGGWAVTTIERLPDYAVIGQPVPLEFMVRQHGHQPAAGLTASVEAQSGGTRTTASARETGQPGRYRADLVLPRGGDWTVDVTHGFGTTSFTLAAVSSASQAPTVMAPEEQGLRLFGAKGCATCHVHGAVPAGVVSGYGPSLAGQRYPAEYLAAKLADPVPCATGKACMPVLGIRPEEIGPLAAFLNAPPERKVRRSVQVAR